MSVKYISASRLHAASSLSFIQVKNKKSSEKNDEEAMLKEAGVSCSFMSNQGLGIRVASSS